MPVPGERPATGEETGPCHERTVECYAYDAQADRHDHHQRGRGRARPDSAAGASGHRAKCATGVFIVAARGAGYVSGARRVEACP